MTDPFDRVVAREIELREQEEADLEAVRQSALASAQGAIVFAFALPVHLLANGWAMTPLVAVHVALLLACALGAATHAIDRVRRQRAPVYHLGRVNVVVSGWKKKERW